MNNKKYDGVFEGGGVKGVALIGAVKRMEEEGIEFSRVAGTSAGAISAALIAARYKANEVKDLLWRKNFNDFANIQVFTKKRWGILFSSYIFKLVSLFFLRKGYGVFATDNFYLWIKDLLEQKGITDFKSTPVYLRIFAVDVLRQRLLQYDKDLTPDMEVAEAVRRSMSIPLFFKAKKQEDALIVDGGVLANYPISTFGDRDSLISTIGFKLISKGETLPPSFPGNVLAYIMRIFETVQKAHERTHVEKAEWARTIPIPTGKISTIKFDLTEDEKQFLWEAGYDAAEKAIKDGVLTEKGRE